VTPIPERPARWTLSRAGIINVYQYGDETLNFGGGRLLLRGVNRGPSIAPSCAGASSAAPTLSSI